MTKPSDSPAPGFVCSRRRALRIVAGSIGIATLPRAAFGKPAVASPPLHRWEGKALGAEGTILLYHPDATYARTLLDGCVREIERLESLFSLYRPDSVLCRLNRTGRLAAPPEDFRRLLITAKEWHQRTAGAFNIGVQPLWELYARHFAMPTADPTGPAPSAIAHARGLADIEGVCITREEIFLKKAGMALTLNGIAQGYITDRVAEFLKTQGMRHVLVELGEFRAIAARPDGRPWRIGIANPDRPWRAIRTLPLREGAIATSGSYGMPFEPTVRHHHLFDPFTGRSANHHRSVTVLAPEATTADALSTALAILPQADGERLLAELDEVGAVFLNAQGAVFVNVQSVE
ncbi:MAG: FAD:protein FMN transferase [Pseudomonadota bacterium]